MGSRNKQQRHIEALAQAYRYPSYNNDMFGGFYDKPLSGDVVLYIDIYGFISVIQSNLNNRPLYYSVDSDRINQHSKSEISKALKLTR